MSVLTSEGDLGRDLSIEDQARTRIPYDRLVIWPEASVRTQREWAGLCRVSRAPLHGGLRSRILTGQAFSLAFSS